MMKKYIAIISTLLVLTFTFTACEDTTDPGGTEVEKMTGDWWVTITNTGTDYEGEYGPYLITTYNTAANVPTEMWLDDGGHFWDFKLKVNVNYSARIFATDGFVDNESYESKVKVTDGKVTKDTAVTPSGMPADKIEFKVFFDDDDLDGTAVFVVTGFRRSGFPADDF